MKDTKLQKLIYKFYNDEFKTTKQIAILLKCSQRYVQKVIKNYGKKPAVSQKFPTVRQEGGWGAGGAFVSNGNNPLPFRLHNQRFRIAIKEQNGLPSRLELSEAMIMIYSKSIIVYSKHSFIAHSLEELKRMSQDFWPRFLSKLQQSLKIRLLYSNWKNVSVIHGGDIAEVGNGLAEQSHTLGNKMIIRGVDGLIWLFADFSNERVELDFQHSREAWNDVEKIGPFFNQLRQNPNMISDLLRITAANSQHIGQLSNIMASIVPQEPKRPDYSDIPEYIN